jgi:RNA polymerase sigma-B factor
MADARHLRYRMAHASDDELLLTFRRTGDRRVRELLVERYMPFARKLALRYNYTQEPNEDLVQVASIGLLKAIDRYEPSRGSKFRSFAAPTILGELKRHFRDKSWAVHVPRGIQERALALTRQTETLSSRLGRSPTLTELAEAMKCPLDEVLEATHASRSYDAVSLDAPVSADGEESLPLGELLGNREDGFELAEERQAMAERWRSLSDLEREVVQLRVVHDMTQREIGQRIGYSQMHVSRLLRRSLERLELTPAAT